MRTLLSATLILCLAGLAAAQDPKKDAPKKDAPKKEKPPITLKVGDPAPSLRADKWLQGAPVKAFTPGHVYVVEFWATWCGPCIVMMPHMSEMQAEYRDRHVTFIGYSAKDPSNTAEKVAQFVEKRGPKLGYTFAYCDDRETYTAWMGAAGRTGIPCSFIVDQKGKLAYIGHPMYLDLVLPKVVGGSWSELDVTKLAEIEKEVTELFKISNSPDAEAALTSHAEFAKKHPALSHIPYFISPKIMLMIRAKRTDDAKKFAEEVMAKAIKQEDPTALRSVSFAMRSPVAAGNKELTAIALKAALAGLKLSGDKDVSGLMNVADSYFATGDKAKAKEYAEKALAVADNPRMKQSIETTMKKYDEEKK